ncbi:ABC-ATPase domain-containing protein [Clostridium sp.]|uniref:ABC-ATPase domain-containing protein n=1 Tax=Clostridium sp. TaxID=1506 RepID=UPI003217E877
MKKILLEIDDCNVSYYRKVYEDNAHIISRKLGSTPDASSFKRKEALQSLVKGPYYYYNDIEFKFDITHKLLLEKPTITIKIPLSHLGLKDTNSHSPIEKLAIEDYCLRKLSYYINLKNTEYYSRTKEAKVTGMLYILNPGQEILKRNCSFFKDDNYLCIMMQALLPIYKDKEKKLTINGKKAAKIMTRDLPQILDDFIDNFDNAALNNWLKIASIQEQIRKFLSENSYCSFVANGSILPRLKGTELPQENALPFISPMEDEVKINLNDGNSIIGMGVKKGVTIITGGGYSGKSTLLDSISVGVYNHIPGDGRELVITDETAINISAEDGRSIQNLDLSPFIKSLSMVNVKAFSTERASGSTSQAANIIEAINYGSKLFLIDEDRSATNFMIKDSRMKQLIKKEPITPFTDRIRQMFYETGTSTILVIGGSSEYLEIADNVILMEDFVAYNVTEETKLMCFTSELAVDETLEPVNWYHNRKLSSKGFTPYPNEQVSQKVDVIEKDCILIGDEKLDLRMLPGITSHAQLNALAYILRFIEVKSTSETIHIEEAISEVYDQIESNGLDSIFPNILLTERWLELPRKIELAAAINRMRTVKFL